MIRVSLGLAALAAAGVAQQDLVWFKFDTPGSATVLNFGSEGARSAAPKYGPTSGYTAGWFGKGALAGAVFGVQGNSVDTGFRGPIDGDLTIAMALKNRYANIPTRSGFLGRPGFGLSTGDHSLPGLKLRGWGGADLVVDFGTALCAMPGWNHFAIVLDATAKEARWFWNGKLVKSEPIPHGARLSKSTDPILVGRDDVDVCGSRYEMDEVRILGRAVPADEIGRWAKQHQAGYAAHGGSKTSTPQDQLEVTGGMPQLGNGGYALVVRGEALAPAAIVLGGSRLRWGSVDLPIALQGDGLWNVSLDLVVPVWLDDQGTARQEMPIPAVAALDQVTLHTQAFVLTAGGVRVTNAVAHALGY